MLRAFGLQSEPSYSPLPSLPVAEHAMPLDTLDLGHDAAHPPARTPPGLKNTLKDYAGLLREPEYATSLAWVLTGGVGRGLSASGVLMLLNTLGSGSQALPILAVSGFEWLELMGRTVSFVQASYARDIADFNASTRGAPAERARLCRDVAWYGFAGVGCTGVMLGSALGYLYAGLPAAVVLVVTAVAKVMQAYWGTRENGAYNCLKVHLGSQRARAKQADFNRTIQAVEGMVLLNLSKAMPPLVYLGASRGDADDEQLARIGIVCMLAGASIVSLSKVHFWWQGRGA